MLLSFPEWNGEFANILLNDHVAGILSDTMVTPRSFTITPQSLSISIAKNVELITAEKTLGIDRNLRNVTFGNDEEII